MARAWPLAGYTEVRELGRGATGTVVLGVHDATGTAVAIKYLDGELCAEEGFRAEYPGEVERLAAVDDPHVVRPRAYVEAADGVALVTDLVDGVSLRRMLDDEGPVEPEAALRVLQGSLLGLGAGHAVGVVHRDHKPENVLVTAAGDSLLTDFGIAGRAGWTATVSGTPAYMAPEQWRGAAASPRTDLYAATTSFVECLTGRPPYRCAEPELLRRQHERAPLPVDEVPGPVQALVRRGMAKDPAHRPPGVVSFVAELDAAASAGYGTDWAERGRRLLAARAARLVLLFPQGSPRAVAP